MSHKNYRAIYLTAMIIFMTIRRLADDEAKNKI